MIFHVLLCLLLRLHATAVGHPPEAAPETGETEAPQSSPAPDGPTTPAGPSPGSSANEAPRGSASPSKAPLPASGKGSIRGEVGFSRREKVTGATIALVGNLDRFLLVLTSTDADGMFKVDAIPEGRYRMVAVRDGIQPAVKDGIEVRAPFRAVTDVIVQRGQGPAPLVSLAASASELKSNDGAAPLVAGEILLIAFVDADGRPREGARFQMSRIGGGADPIWGESGGDGRLSLARPPAGRYSLRIESPGHIPLHVDELEIPAENGAPLVIRAHLVVRPFSYPGTIQDLLPEVKPLPPPDLEPTAAPSPASG